MSRRRPGLAASAPVPVFVAAGSGSDRALAHLRASTEIRLVASPRHATVLVVAGSIPDGHRDAFDHVHDQVLSPRALAVVGGRPPAGYEHAVVLDPDDPVADLRRLHGEVVAGHDLSAAVGPAQSPTPWQGVGPHGQGGEGMMGGVPYGRPMAMTADGRDGLALDRLDLVIGPFVPGLPPGVTAAVGLQGDVLERVEIDIDAGVPGGDADVGLTAARRGLVALAELAALAGLDAIAVRAARLATSEDTDATAVERLGARLARPWGLRPATDGVGNLDVPGIPPGDVTARWRRWVDGAAAASRGEEPPPPLGPVDLDALAASLVGAELGRAVLTLASVRPELTTARIADRAAT